MELKTKIRKVIMTCNLARNNCEKDIAILTLYLNFLIIARKKVRVKVRIVRQKVALIVLFFYPMDTKTSFHIIYMIYKHQNKLREI